MRRRIKLSDLSEDAKRRISHQIHKDVWARVTLGSGLPRPTMKPITDRPSPMNKTEQRHANMLDALKHTKEILDWRFEPLKFKLAPSTYYTPDFLVIKRDCFEIHEIKGGFVRDDALVKVKTAVDMFPWFRWKMYKYTKEGTQIIEYGKEE